MWPHNTIAQFQQWEENLRTNKKGWYGLWCGLKRTTSFICGAIVSLLISGQGPNLHWGWIMIILTWLGGVGIFAGFLVFDCVKAKKKGFQMFWRPWFLVFVLATLFLIQRCFVTRQIPELNPYWEERCANAPLLGIVGTEAFRSGEYAYSFLVFSAMAGNGDAVSLVGSNCPLLYASQLANNPTAEGYRIFNQQIDDLCAAIETQMKTDRNKEKLQFNFYGAVHDVIDKLVEVEERLPKNEQKHIGEIIKKVRTLEKEKLKADKNWEKE